MMRRPEGGQNSSIKEFDMQQEKSLDEQQQTEALQNEQLQEDEKQEEKRLALGKKIKIWTIVILIVITCLIVKELAGQKLTSIEDFQKYIAGFGPAGPLILTVFQAFQVVVPILPGYAGCVVGAIAFGWFPGFLCNYIGISLGSIAAYYIARKFGMNVVLTFFPEKQYLKWSSIIEKKKSYGLFLFIATLLPLFPDDFLCYFSGLIKMKAKKFIWIIILGKPWCILAYSLIFGLIR